MDLVVLMRQRMCWVMVCDEGACVEWVGEVCNMFVQRALRLGGVSMIGLVVFNRQRMC